MMLCVFCCSFVVFTVGDPWRASPGGNGEGVLGAVERFSMRSVAGFAIGYGCIGVCNEYTTFSCVFSILFRCLFVIPRIKVSICILFDWLSFWRAIRFFDAIAVWTRPQNLTIQNTLILNLAARSQASLATSRIMTAASRSHPYTTQPPA